jgi:hypothetical protein
MDCKTVSIPSRGSGLGKCKGELKNPVSIPSRGSGLGKEVQSGGNFNPERFQSPLGEVV